MVTADPRSGLVAPLRALVEKWRTRADGVEGLALYRDDVRVAANIRDCADELDTLLASLPQQEEALELALSALPDSETAGPDGTGYKYAWDELDGDEQEWVKDIRRRIALARLQAPEEPQP